ncbi:MAG: N-acetylneuraminate synthase family protein [Flavobacterium sp.]|nr:N-acetylneuraminate synthase family protein [Flavobacterium sp.]
MERDTKINSPFQGKFGPLLIAEIGGNHEGDFEYAKKLSQLAIDTNVDYVKFQIYTGDTLVSQLESPDRNKHFKKFELTKENHIYLAEMVKEAGILYTSSVWDIDAMNWLDKYISLYKIGSGDLTAYPVLKKTAEKGKPIIISTGLSSEHEVLKTIEYIQSVNSDYKSAEMLAVLQCTSMYPIPSADANLNVMKRLKELTNLTIGYSDHTEGSKALNYAVAIGAEVLEFHFTDSREGKQFRDHKVSLTPNEITELIQEIQLINDLKGNNIKKPVLIEIVNGHVESFRRAVYPSKNIKAGEVLTENNLTVLRPNHGIDARDFDKLIGKVLKKDVLKHQKLDWNLIE